MADELKGQRIAIVATDGFEQSELLEPQKRLMEAGAKVDVIAPKEGRIQGMQHHAKGKTVAVDRTIDAVKPDEYAALVLPGGVANPDALRTDARVVNFVRAFFEQQKPVAAICHGPWTLIEAGVVKNRTMTSWPSLKTDLKNSAKANTRLIDPCPAKPVRDPKLRRSARRAASIGRRASPKRAMRLTSPNECSLGVILSGSHGR